MNVPESEVTNTGEDPQVLPHKFFNEVIRVYNLCVKPNLEIQYKNHVTDGLTILLIYNNRVVASVIEWRTDFNFCHWNYAIYI
jgi:hypothetical protein